MVINNILLKNFRNYDNLNIIFDSKINIIIGDNAQGKTNLLEAIYVLAVTKSFLQVADNDLIKYNCNFSYIKGELSSNIGNLFLDILFTNHKKRLKINNVEIKKNSDYMSKMNVIFFSSDNIRLFKENPSQRRRYFNIQISQVNKDYLKILIEYNKILKKRNEFLKIFNRNNETDISYLKNINEIYVDISLRIYNYRKSYIDKLNKFINAYFFSIIGSKREDDSINIEYISNVSSDRKEFLNNLDKILNKEIKYKMTLIGPNRDDYKIIFNEKDLSIFGSQGQIRSGILALTLSEVNLFYDLKGDYPILLLDDIFSELDIKTRNNLLNNLNYKVQTIITTTDLNNIDKNIVLKSKIFNIKNGKLFPGK